MIVINRIRELREDSDLKQSDVSKATGIDQRTLSNYETGKTNPDSSAIIRLADFFDVSADYLLGREFSNEKEKSIATKQLESMSIKLRNISESLDDISKKIKKW